MDVQKNTNHFTQLTQEQRIEEKNQDEMQCVEMRTMEVGILAVSHPAALRDA
jgi:hypothetical protein